MLRDFVNDVLDWGWGTAVFNLRFTIGTRLCRWIVGEPMYFLVRD